MGNRGSADNWSTAPEERSFTFLRALSPLLQNHISSFRVQQLWKHIMAFYMPEKTALTQCSVIARLVLIRCRYSSKGKFCFIHIFLLQSGGCFLFSPLEGSWLVFCYGAALVWLNHSLLAQRHFSRTLAYNEVLQLSRKEPLNLAACNRNSQPLSCTFTWSKDLSPTLFETWCQGIKSSCLDDFSDHRGEVNVATASVHAWLG